MRGIIYSNPALYNLMMRLIYGGEFIKRYEAVAGEIGQGWSVLDLCCGDCFIKKFLDPSVEYEGRDFNEVFLKNAERHGIKASFADLKKGLNEHRKFDCVIMMGSFHQFMPAHEELLNSMKRASVKKVIISEPVKNIVSSNNGFISWAAKLLSNPGGEETGNIKRFSKEEMADIFKKNNVSRTIDLGKDFIGVFDL